MSTFDAYLKIVSRLPLPKILIKNLRRNRALLSLIITMIILALLLLPPSAVAISVNIENLDGVQIGRGQVHTFYININIESGERVPINHITVSISGPTSFSKTFTAEGGEDPPITLTPWRSYVEGVEMPFGYGFGFGMYRSYGITGYLYNTSYYLYGYGYGPFGYGYGYPGPQILQYKVDLDTAYLSEGNYVAVVAVEADGTQFISPEVSFTVLPEPYFTLTLDPDTISFTAGETVSTNVTVTSYNMFASEVELSVTVPPELQGLITPTFTPTNVITPPPNGERSVTLVLTTSTAIPAGSYNLTVVGEGGGMVREATLTLEVSAAPPPDFELTLSKDSISIRQGEDGSVTVNLTSINQFSGSVSLAYSASDLSGNPVTGITVSFDQNAPTLPPNGTVSVTATISVDATVEPGDYTVTIHGASGTLSHEDSLTVTVTPASQPDFELTVTPDTVTIEAGDSEDVTVMLTSLQGFEGDITLSVTGPISFTHSFSVNPVTVSAGGQTSVTLTITIPDGTPAGNYTFTVTGECGALSHSDSFTVAVPQPPPTFRLTLSETLLTIERGSSDAITATITSLNGYTGNVTLTVTGLPSGVSYLVIHDSTVSPTVPVPANDEATATIVFMVADDAETGTSLLTVTASDGTIERSSGVNLTVPAPAPDFTIYATPNYDTVIADSSTASIIELTSVNGFEGDVSLAVTAPDGFTASLIDSTISLTADGSDNTTLTVYVGPNVTPDIYTITVTATATINGETVTHETHFFVEVQAAPDFSLSATPNYIQLESMSIPDVDSVTIRVASVNGFSGSVDLTITAEEGLTVQPETTSVTVPANGISPEPIAIIANLGGATTPGTYYVTVEGTATINGQPVTHSTVVIVEVS